MEGYRALERRMGRSRGEERIRVVLELARLKKG
jgi:hypothetical protein